MACPPYVPPAGASIHVILQPGYIAPAGDGITGVLDPCAGGGGGGTRLYRDVLASFGSSGRRDVRPVDGAWRPKSSREQFAVSRWDPSAASNGAVWGRWSPCLRADSRSGSGWTVARRVLVGAVSGWTPVLPCDPNRSLRWEPATVRIGLRQDSDWHRVFARDVEPGSAWSRAVLPGTYVVPNGGISYVPPLGDAIVAVLQAGYTPPPPTGISAVIVGSGAATPYVAVRQDPQRRNLPWGGVPFKDAQDRIVWGRGGKYGGRDPLIGLPWVNAPPSPPPQPPFLKVHLAMNNVSVVRLPDMAPIEVLGVDLSANVDTWCWTVRMELADPSQLTLLLPNGNGPRMVQITMNSYVWTAIIEGRERSRGFGQATVTVAGRSRTALLDSPFAPRRSGAESNPRTARQLAEAELINTGFALDWAGTDWLVPGGAWYYSDMTPAAVLQDIASAAGAVLQSHPSNASLSVKARYPTAPWGWSAATADLVLPASWVVEDSTQYASKPMYDAVFVRGEQQGVQSRITRQGSAGETFAEQVVHKLITHADVSVQRGITALGDRGEQELVDVKIPLFVPGIETGGASGLFLPLNLVEVQDLATSWRGLSVGVSISARRSGERNAALEVWQNVSLERHLTDAG